MAVEELQDDSIALRIRDTNQEGIILYDSSGGDPIIEDSSGGDPIIEDSSGGDTSGGARRIL